jgi:hypothetical protein
MYTHDWGRTSFGSEEDQVQTNCNELDDSDEAIDEEKGNYGSQMAHVTAIQVVILGQGNAGY